jgi:hypothetical protein
MEKDLVDKDAALQGWKAATQTTSDDEEACNNQTRGRRKGKESQHEDRQGTGEKDEEEGVGLKATNFRKEKEKKERKWKETITKLEQCCDLLTNVVQQEHKGKASLVDSLF